MGRGKGEVEHKIPRARRGVEDAVGAPVEVPVEQRNPGIALVCLRDPEALPRDALVVDQPPLAGSDSAACAKMICCGAKALALAGSIPGASGRR